MRNRKQKRAAAKQAPLAAPATSSAISQLFNEAFRHHQAGRLLEAERLYRQILAADSRHADSLHLLGLIAQQMGRNEIAIDLISQAIRINDKVAAYHSNLGVAFKESSRLEEAIGAYKTSACLKPDSAEAYSNMGFAFKDLGRLDEAVKACKAAIWLTPDYAAAYSNLGNALNDLGLAEEATVVLRRAIGLKPDYAEAYSNLGNALKALRRYDAAVVTYKIALGLKPDYAGAHCNVGSALADCGRFDDAAVAYETALRHKPDLSDAYSNLLFCMNYHPDKSAQEIFLAHRGFEKRFGSVSRAPLGNDRDPSRRLKVGYVSPDFRHHSTRHFLEPLLAHHDKAVVEVYAYAELKREDPATARYRGYADHWIETRGMSDQALAERIHADGIDILVDLAGHTANNRLGVFARKPAPVSLSWLGYGYTTGLSAIDYFLCDEVTAPVGSEALFAETPWRLATPGFAYRPAEGMGEVSALPALENGMVTFGTLTRAVRINHRSIRVWSEILRLVPGSRLVVDSKNFQHEPMQDALAAKFAAHGIARERLVIGCHSPPWDVLRGMDIGLDCFPHNSGTTLFETLYMGVPYVTLTGRPSVGRLGASILQGAGHPEWIAESEDEYIEIAVRLASDIATLAKIRSRLRGEMGVSPVMDEAGFARKAEAAYRRMWQRWCE